MLKLPLEVHDALSRLYELQKDLYTIFINQKSELTQKEYLKLAHILHAAERSIIEMAGGIEFMSKTKVLVEDSPKYWDFDCNGLSPIMLFYHTDKKGNFDNFFHANLNPDVAPVGFLEELDKLITIKKKRDVVLKCNNATGNKKCPCAIIKSYLELF